MCISRTCSYREEPTEAHLADLAVARQSVRIFKDGRGGGAPVAAVTDLDHRPPLGKACPLLIVLLAPVSEAIQTL